MRFFTTVLTGSTRSFPRGFFTIVLAGFFTTILAGFFTTILAGFFTTILAGFFTTVLAGFFTAVRSEEHRDNDRRGASLTLQWLFLHPPESVATIRGLALLRVSANAQLQGC